MTSRAEALGEQVVTGVTGGSDEGDSHKVRPVVTWPAGCRLAARIEHTSRTLRFGFWWSARLVKGAARAWVCLRLGAALSDSARQCPGRGGAGVHSSEQLVCVHWLWLRARCCAASRDACAGW